MLKLLKMAKGIRALLDTVMQALPQVGNLGLLFFLLFFIFAALGVEMFGRLGKSSREMGSDGSDQKMPSASQAAMNTTLAKASGSTRTFALSAWPSSRSSASPPATTGTES